MDKPLTDDKGTKAIVYPENENSINSPSPIKKNFVKKNDAEANKNYCYKGMCYKKKS